MNSELSKLIPAIVSYVNDRDSYVSKTKLLKLLYLFDVEYYRMHRSTYTGFNWKYYHLGPWTAEYDGVLDSLLANQILTIRRSSDPGYDTEFYSSPEYIDISRLFSGYKDESILKNILYTWGEKSTPEILDYVYFRTEPMQHGERNEPLDFSHIGAGLPEYKRTSSGKTQQEIQAARQKIRERRAAREGQQARTVTFTPPKYDEEFFESMEKIEALNY